MIVGVEEGISVCVGVGESEGGGVRVGVAESVGMAVPVGEDGAVSADVGTEVVTVGAEVPLAVAVRLHAPAAAAKQQSSRHINRCRVDHGFIQLL